MQTLLNDLRYAMRQLRKRPGMATLAIATLALGIGANTAIFTVVENVLLRPLPYANSDRMVYVGGGTDEPGFASTSWLNYRDIRSQSSLLQNVAGYTEDISVLQTQDASLSIAAPRVTTNLFSMLGAQPLLGRTFNDAEGQAGGPMVVHALRILVAAEFSCRSQHHEPSGKDQRETVHGRRRHAAKPALPGRIRSRSSKRRVAASAAYAGNAERPRLQLLQHRRTASCRSHRSTGAAGIECDRRQHYS